MQKSELIRWLEPHEMSIDDVNRLSGFPLIELKEDLAYIADKGREWFYHLGYLLERRSLQSLLEVYRQGSGARIISDACNFIMSYIERLPKLENFWICSPWIVIDEKNRPRFGRCLEKIDRIQVITRPPDKNAQINLRKSVHDSLTWLNDRGVEKICLHENVHAKVYLLEESINSWRNRLLILGSENFTFSENPELSICIHEERLFRQAKNMLGSLITGKKFKSC
jgi:hypothetical protein